MATIQDQWQEVTKDPRFGELDDDKKETVRKRFFNTRVQKDPKYLALDESKRQVVRKRFDDFSKTEDPSIGDKVIGAAKKIAGFVDPSKIGSDVEDIASTAQEIPGAKKVAGAISGAAEKVAGAVEPNFVKPSLTAFDMARAIGSGAIRTVGEFLSGMVPETTQGAAAYAIPADAILKMAGTTFLGADIHLPGWKPKSGLSEETTSLGDEFEKIVTQRRIENNGRAATAGPPKPLEILANKESEIKAQGEFNDYQEWLQKADKMSPQGGEPEGDLYPQAKTNITQLRDMAKERLQKLQNEPVRVESIGKAEDELQGYYRRKVDQARVYMMPSGPESEPQAALPGRPEPAGLLKAGETPPKTPESLPERPIPTKTPPPGPPAAAPAKPSLDTMKAGDVVAKMYQAYNPDQTIQANKIRAGALLKALGMKSGEPLTQEHLSMLEKIMESEHTERLTKEMKSPLRVDAPKLQEKGLDPSEVKAEAMRLKEEHDFKNKTMSEERARLKDVTGGVSANVPENEEIRTGIPNYLRGSTPPDEAAQMAFDAGIIKEPSLNSLIEHAKKFEGVERPRSANSFLDEAEYNLEMQNHRKAGFKPEPQSLPGMPQSQIPGSAIPTLPGQAPIGGLFDIKEKSAFDLTADLFKNLDEKGEIGGEIDPVKQAQKEAIIKELVDRAMSMGYETSQDIMLYCARNAPKEVQDAIRKNLAPTLSAFDTHAYKEMDAARQGSPAAKRSMMDNAQRSYLSQKADILKGKYRKFKANQQVVLFKDMDEGLMRLKNDLFIHDNYRKFSKDELAAQRWYTEGKSPKLESLTALGVPEETAKRWLDLAKNPTETMKSARPMTQIFEDEYHEVLSDFYDRVGYREDHVTRRWKRPEEYIDWEGRTLSNRPNFLKGAKLLSQAQGIDAGMEPVSFDIREDLRASNNARVNILSRIHAYQKLGASFGPDGMPAIIDESVDAMTQAKNAKITPHAGQAPPSWIRTNDIPLLKGLAINPYYKPAMKFMMSRPFQGVVPDVLDFLSASTKATKLMGFFHGYTLGEMTMSGISYRDVFSFGKNRNPLFRGLRYAVKGMTADLEGETLEWGTPSKGIKSIGKLYNSFMTGSGMLANRPLALDMTEHGFKFGSADEDMHGVLRKTLNAFEKQLSKRIGEGVAKGLTALPRTALDIQEKSLWSYVRPISSMLVYETNLKDSILKFNLEEMDPAKKIPVDQIKQMIANQTSKEMGGISYARLMVNPRTQQVLQWAMLAPGWTIGRALMGASVLEKGPEGRQARKQMAKLFVGWFFSSNMINYAQTKKYLGKGRYMWDNPEGYRNQAFLGKEKDGSTRYLQLSKALTEIYDDIDHPMRTAAYKVSAPVQAAVKVMNWSTARAYYPGIGPENPAKAVLEMYEPMVTSGQSAYGGLPVRHGPSKNKVEAMLNEYYAGGMKNQALFQDALQVATEQGYDASKLDRSVRGSRSRERNRALLQ